MCCQGFRPEPESSKPQVHLMSSAMSPAGELLKKAQGYEVAEARDELRRMSQRTVGGGQWA